MSGFLTRVRKGFAHPGQVLPFLLWRWRCLQVKEVTREGQPYYRYRGRLYPTYLNEGNARAFINDLALAHCRGQGIDVGAGDWPLPGAVAVQDEPHQNAHKLDAFPDGSLDFVFSSHCLEHLERWQDALSLWIRKLRIGGTLFLYLPHESNELWKPGGPLVGDGHKWSPTHQILVPFLEDRNIRILDCNRDRDAYWSFHIVGERTG